MKLNPDCIRAILLAVENTCDMEHYFSSAEDMDKIQGDFSAEEIAYHVRQCDLAGMLYNCKRKDGVCIFSIGDLTPAGHEFLANIRDDSIWKSVKDVARKVGAKSTAAIAQVAKIVVTELIKERIKGISITSYLS